MGQSSNDLPSEAVEKSVKRAGIRVKSSSKQISQGLKQSSRQPTSEEQHSSEAEASTEAEKDASEGAAKKLRKSKELSSVLSAKEQAASPEATSKGDEEGGLHSSQKLPKPGLTYKRFKKEVLETQEQHTELPKEGVLQDSLEAFKTDSKVKDKALALYVSSEVYSPHAPFHLRSKTHFAP